MKITEVTLKFKDGRLIDIESHEEVDSRLDGFRFRDHHITYEELKIGESYWVPPWFIIYDGDVVWPIIPRHRHYFYSLKSGGTSELEVYLDEQGDVRIKNMRFAKKYVKERAKRGFYRSPVREPNGTFRDVR